MSRTQPLAGAAILVVEDEAMIAWGMRDHLLSVGAARVDMALSLGEAMALSKARKFDMAVLDIRLPGGTTHELARTLTDTGCVLLFHSGHMTEEELRQEFPEARLCPKPGDYNQIVKELATAT